MGKNCDKGPRYSKNCFRMRGRPELYFKGQVLVNFSRLHKKKEMKESSTVPTFNKDGQYFTVAFQLPCFRGETSNALEDHQRRVQEAQVELTQLWMPKPRSRHRYCGVCRNYYEDYKEHVDSQAHQESLRNSHCHQIIKELAADLQQKHRKDEDQKTAGQSHSAPSELSEEQLFKCLSSDTLEFRNELAL